MAKSLIKSVELVEGERIETKVQRVLSNKEPIKDGAAPEIFTERKDGVLAGFNIRSDRFEIAADAMDKVNASKIAERMSKVRTDKEGKVYRLDGKEVGDQSIHGKAGNTSQE